MPGPAGRSAGAVAHLAGCPGCAEIADAADRLDRAWAATRPADPTASEVDRAWRSVSAALDRPGDRASILAFEPAARRGPRRLAVAVAGLAAAAAILLIVPTPGPAPIAPPAVPPVAAADPWPTTEVGLDETQLVRLGKPIPELVILVEPSTNPAGLSSLAESTNHDLMNAFESLAQ